MKGKIITSLIIGIILIGLTSALDYPKDTAINLQFTCLIDGELPSNSAEFNLTISDPKGNIVFPTTLITAQGNGKFNQTFTFLQYGTYTLIEECYDGNLSSGNQELVNIIGIGNTRDKGITESSIYLIIAIVIGILIYTKVSNFFGSLMIFLIGFGILFSASENGWIGWTVIGSGFLMVIYALIEPQRKRYRR